MASKEQQIQRDDPGASLQSSSQPDHGRLSRKPSNSEGQAEGNKDKLSQRTHCCRLNEVRVLRSKSPSDIFCISLVNHNENMPFGENTGITESVDPENINSLPSIFAEE